MSESGVPTSYLQSEFIASGRSRDFYKFIKTLSAVRSKPEETDLVNSELQKLSMKMNQPNVTSSTMNEYLIKLIHCALLGYDIDVGIIYAIMATQSGENIAQRRVGYLICTLVLNKQHDLSIMLINTLQRDLKSSNYLDTCAALNALCYLDHLEMVDHLLEPTLKTMESTRQIVRKKGVLALYWFYRRSPLLLDQIEPFLKAALLDKDASVVFVALDIWKKILVDKAEHYQDLLSTIMRIHQQILGRYIHRGYMYHGVLAPWAQITCLQIYGLYQHHGIGSQKDIFGLVITCLRGMENKVDAAYAIILECIKLLSTMDTLLLSTLISDDDTSPFYLLDPFLKANNHTMRYLGLTGLAYVKTTTLWHVDWKDGTLLANIMQSSNDDSVLVKKVIPVLDICVTTEQDLHRIQTALLDSIKQYKDPELVDLVSRWFIGKMDDCVASEWWVETMLRLLASTRTHLDDEFMEIQCHSLKQVLLDEVDDTKLRTKAVNTSYDILSTMSTNDVLAPTCMQILFWILGEHAYLSTKYSELSVMELLQRYILLIQDNPLLQVCNLQAIKRCIMRSKSYLSGLEYILQLEYIKSPIMEKQQVAREIMMLLDDMDLVKKSQEHTDPPRMKKAPRHLQQTTRETRRMGDTNNPFSGTRHELGSISDNANQAIPGTRGHKDRPRRADDQPIKSMMSSLLDMEIKGDDDRMTTDTFGRLWLSYPHEQKLQWEAAPTLFNDDIIRWVQEQWEFDVVETIQQECLAMKKLHQHQLVLIHMKIDLPYINITLRSQNASTLYQFSQLFHL